MLRREFLAGLICLPGSALAAEVQDQTGLGDAIREGAAEFLKDIGGQSKSWREEAIRLRGWQESLMRGPDPAALAQIEALVKAGHAAATNFLGWLLDHGRGGIPRDSYKAAAYFRQAGTLGDQNGLYNLALLLLMGRGVRADRTTATDLLTRIERKGHELAAIRLAMLAEESGKYDEAARYYGKATIGRRHPYAIYKAGLYTFRGGAATGGRDRKSGLMLLERAAGLWSTEAMASLVEIHGQGIFVPPNPVEAAKWFLLLQQNPYLRNRASLPSLRGMFVVSDGQWKDAERAAAIWIRFHDRPETIEEVFYDRTVP